MVLFSRVKCSCPAVPHNSHTVTALCDWSALLRSLGSQTHDPRPNLCSDTKLLPELGGGHLERCKSSSAEILIAECEIRLHGLRCDGRKKPWSFQRGKKKDCCAQDWVRTSHGSINLGLVRFTLCWNISVNGSPNCAVQTIDTGARKLSGDSV